MKKFSILVMATLSFFIANAQNIRVATYNIRLQTPEDIGNLWDDRKNALCNLIKFHEFEIFGVQEAFHNQLTDINNALTKYKHIGVGRDDGKTKGEYSAIFYDSTRFELLNNGTFWLSGTDTKQPNKGWDAALPRICTWGIFLDRKNDKKFIFLNTHFDHVGKIARKESGKLILEKARTLSNNLPIILTGDFNIDQKDEAYLGIANSGLVKDTHEISPLVYEPNSTFHDWGKRLRQVERIDHIFVSANFSVKKWGILTDTYMGKFPSDHFPVMVDLTWK